MDEVTQNTFHKLQAMIESGISDRITGPVSIRRSSSNPENIVYENSRGKWLQRYNGICFARPRLISFLEKIEKKSGK